MYQQQALNRQTQRTVQTTAFMMTRGHRNAEANYSRYITFENLQFSANAMTYREYGAFQASMPGLYFMSFTIRGNTTTGTEVQMRGPRRAIYSTATVPDDRQVTSNALVLLQRNDTVYLQIVTGGILENTAANGTYNSFMGFLLVAENLNPFLQNVFGSNSQNPNNLQNVGSFAGQSFVNPMGNNFGIPFAT